MPALFTRMSMEPEGAECVGHCVIDGDPIPHVETDGSNFRAGFFKFRSGRIVRRLIAIEKDEACAVIGEEASDPIPDAGGGPGNQRNFVLQEHAIVDFR